MKIMDNNKQEEEEEEEVLSDNSINNVDNETRLKCLISSKPSTKEQYIRAETICYEKREQDAFCANFANQLKESNFSDILLICSKPIRANKVVLAASSKYFTKIFKYNEDIERIDLLRILGNRIGNAIAIDEAIKFIYNHEIKISSCAKAMDLFKCASILELVCLYSHTSKYLEAHLRPDTYKKLKMMYPCRPDIEGMELGIIDEAIEKLLN